MLACHIRISNAIGRDTCRSTSPRSIAKGRLGTDCRSYRPVDKILVYCHLAKQIVNVVIRLLTGLNDNGFRPDVAPPMPSICFSTRATNNCCNRASCAAPGCFAAFGRSRDKNTPCWCRHAYRWQERSLWGENGALRIKWVYPYAYYQPVLACKNLQQAPAGRRCKWRLLGRIQAAAHRNSYGASSARSLLIQVRLQTHSTRTSKRSLPSMA